VKCNEDEKLEPANQERLDGRTFDLPRQVGHHLFENWKKRNHKNANMQFVCKMEHSFDAENH